MRIIVQITLWLCFAFASLAQAQECPGENTEPAMQVKTEAGPTLILCGFEDREVPKAAGKRAFSDFSIFSWLPTPAAGASDAEKAAAKDPKLIFKSEESETYFAQSLDKKGLLLEELWFFSEKPQPALQRDLTCTKTACEISAPKCIFKMKKPPFPKAVANFEKAKKAGKLKEDGEELIDQIFAQALTGDKAAKTFYQTKPADLPAELSEIFDTNRNKLMVDCKTLL